MRYNDGRDKGSHGFLLIECMIVGQSEGLRWFNLGMADASGLEEPLARREQLGRMGSAMARRFTKTSRGLRKFKEEVRSGVAPR